MVGRWSPGGRRGFGSPPSPARPPDFFFRLLLSLFLLSPAAPERTMCGDRRGRPVNTSFRSPRTPPRPPPRQKHPSHDDKHNAHARTRTHDSEEKPPITQLIEMSNVPRVVIGCQDPIAEYASRGAGTLHASGLSVTMGAAATRGGCESLISGYAALANSKLQRMARQHMRRFGRVSSSVAKAGGAACGDARVMCAAVGTPRPKFARAGGWRESEGGRMGRGGGCGHVQFRFFRRILLIHRICWDDDTFFVFYPHPPIPPPSPSDLIQRRTE